MVALLTLLATLLSSAPSYGSFETAGALVAENCAPVAATSDGTMVWYSRNGKGIWDAYIGNADCQGTPLLAPYEGNRAPADMTSDGRYVLLTTAVGWDRALPFSAPGRGSQNAIQLYDRKTGHLSTLLGSGTSSQRGVIWPKLSPDGTKIAWSQMLETASEGASKGRWALHVADVNLEAGTLSHNVEWQDPNGQPAFYEDYGWIPGTNELIFMSTTRATIGGWGQAQLFTLPDTLDPTTAPTRISPPYPSAFAGQPPFDAYHEFAAFAPEDPHTLYTSVGADTVGGDDLFAYDMRTQQASGLLTGPPRHITYFGGDAYFNRGTQAIPGWPAPSYKVVTTMAWINGWVATACPDLLCEQVSAWRILPSAASPPPVTPPASTSGSGEPAPAPEATKPPRAPRHRVHAVRAKRKACVASTSRGAGVRRARCKRATRKKAARLKATRTLSARR